MAIDFPNSPADNEQYTVGDRTWTWNGTYWEMSTSTSTFTAGDSEPVDADPGDIWFDSTIGKTFVNYNGAWVEIGNAATVVDVIADADADTKVQVEVTADSDKIEFTTAGTKRLEIDASGHVIPAANEAYDLGSASNRFRDIYLSGTTIDLGGVEISSDGTSLTMPPVSNISGDFTVGTDVLHVDHANSSIGIGTTTPGQTLDVKSTAGNLSSGNVSDGTKGTLFLQNSGGTKADGELSVGVAFSGTNTGRRRAMIAAFQDGTDGDPHGLQFFTYGATNSASDAVTSRMTIGSDGNVGIGTTSPSERLHVIGDILIGKDDDVYLVFEDTATPSESFIKHDSTDGSLVLAADQNASLADSGISMRVDGVTRMRLDSSGNLGIGTTTPGSPLHLFGAGNAVDQIRISSNTGTVSEYGFLGADASTDVMRYGYWTGSGFGNHHFEGNVGINESSPSHKLDVNGNIRGAEIFNEKIGPSYPSSAGWYTIATCSSGRASGLFNIHDPRSGYHGALTFYVNHLYGQETITLLNHNYYSGSGPISAIRVKGIGVYDGAAVQVYFQASSGGVEMYLSENYGEQTWQIKNFIPDATDPGGQSGSWASFTQQQYFNLAGIPRGSTYTTGTVYGASKSFSIPHPTREDYTLNHGAVEGPENGVYHRGRCTDGLIELPDYWDGLVDLDTVTVQLTPIGDHRNWISDISGRTINVGGSGECFYIVHAERVDIDKLTVEQPLYPEPEPEIEGGP